MTKRILLAGLLIALCLFSFPVIATDGINYGFVPNMGEASVSKVDLGANTAVARYLTAPRYSQEVDAFGTPTPGTPFLIKPVAWRTNRIAIDPYGNAWVLNTGVDAYSSANSPIPASAIQGTVVRIQGDTTVIGDTDGDGTAQTNANHAAPLPFGDDDAVRVFAVGGPGDIPRVVIFDHAGNLWIGFHKAAPHRYGYFQKYSYNACTGILTAIGSPVTNTTDPWDLAPYNAAIDKNGVLWFTSYGTANIGRSGVATNGVFSFDTDDAPPVVIKYPGILSGYGILIDNGDLPADPVIAYATYLEGGSNLFRSINYGAFSDITDISGGTGLRSMAFDNNGIVWIASSGNGRVSWYNPADGTSGSSAQIFNIGNGPVGIGRDDAGYMWAIMRGQPYIAKFDPVIPTGIDSLSDFILVGVGNQPYAYGDFTRTVPRYDLCGYKYNDDTGEGIEDWNIDLYKQNDDGTYPASPNATTVTDENGHYCFTGLEAGTYKVVEDEPEGWVAIGITQQEVTLPDYDPCIEEPKSYDFSNAPLYQLCGYKYEAGTDPAAGLDGWTIHLYKQNDAGTYPASPNATTVTDENGHYCFTDLRAGTYKVVEEVQDGFYPWVAEHEVTLPGDSYDPEASYDFYNSVLYCETVWAAQENPGQTRFVPAPGNWATYISYNISDGTEAEPAMYPLFAGQTHPAGTLLVYDSGGMLYVQYVAEGSGEYMPGYCNGGFWMLSEYHLQVVDNVTDFNAYRTFNQKTGNYGAPIPGQFDNIWEYDAEVPYSEWIEIPVGTDWDDPIFIAAHGVACWRANLCVFFPS